MEESFIITVAHKGRELRFETQLLLTGYTHKFKVIVNGREVFFEPDEEGAYRAVLPPTDDEKNNKATDIELLQDIAATIQSDLANSE